MHPTVKILPTPMILSAVGRDGQAVLACVTTCSSTASFLAQLAELIVQLVKSCLCVCVLTRVTQIITATRRN